jgi:mRNA-degrading endonuclease YafQ of YafQ-DinJ toxin-antitoxin module
MRVFVRKGFRKSYANLSERDRKLVDDGLSLFREDPFHPDLKNHALKGVLKGQRAISAGFDLRILYRQEGGHAVVYLLKTGTHNQVY